MSALTQLLFLDISFNQLQHIHATDFPKGIKYLKVSAGRCWHGMQPFNATDMCICGSLACVRMEDGYGRGNDVIIKSIYLNGIAPNGPALQLDHGCGGAACL